MVNICTTWGYILAAPTLTIPPSTTTGTLNWTWGTKTNVYRSFENAKTYVRALDLDSIHSFREFTKMYVSGGPLSNFRLLPPDIPVVPERVYPSPYGDGTPFDWDDFLGIKKKKKSRNKLQLNTDGKWFFPYPEFKKRVQAARVMSMTQYRLWRLSVDYKVNLPRDPEQIYGHEWEGWAILLGTDVYSRLDRIRLLMPFDQAIKFVHGLQLKTQREYQDWWMSVKPIGLPTMPDRTYHRDWIGWPHFLGTRLEAKLAVAKLNVDVLVIAKLKTGNDLYRIYVDPIGSAHALANPIDGDAIIEIFKYNRNTHDRMITVINQCCYASTIGNTIVHCPSINQLIRALNISHEVVRWKEAPAIQYGNAITTTDQRNFANELLIPGRDPVFDQRSYQFDPFDQPDVDFILY